MRFTLVLLFCSLISVSVRAGLGFPATGGSTSKVKKQDPFNRLATKKEVEALQPGQIVGIKPEDFNVSRHYTIGNITVR